MDEQHEGSPRSRPRRRAWRWVFGFLAVVLVAEGAVRVLEPRLPEPSDWFSPAAARLVREMDAAHARGDRGGLVVAGSSMAGRGLLPEIVGAGIAGTDPARSVALNGGGHTGLQARWLLEEVVGRLHPDDLVLGVSSLDFNANRASTIERYDRARATRRGWLAAADRGLARVSALARHRETLRDPYVMSKVLTGTNLHDALPTRPQGEAVQFERGYPRLDPARLARMRHIEATFVRDQQLADYRVGVDEVASFRRTLRELRGAGVRTAVVLMPVTREYLDAHPNGARDFARWQRAATRAARAEGVLVLDDTRVVPDAGFRDIEHLGYGPAKDFSARVNRQLRDAGW